MLVKEWFNLKSDDEVKAKMVELQQMYDSQLEITISDEKMEVIEQELDA